MKFLLLKSVLQKNSFYHEAIEIITMWRVTDFEKAAQEKEQNVVYLYICCIGLQKNCFTFFFRFDTVKYWLYMYLSQ